jgi:hypothetical protein
MVLRQFYCVQARRIKAAHVLEPVGRAVATLGRWGCIMAFYSFKIGVVSVAFLNLLVCMPIVVVSVADGTVSQLMGSSTFLQLAFVWWPLVWWPLGAIGQRIVNSIATVRQRHGTVLTKRRSFRTPHSVVGVRGYRPRGNVFVVISGEEGLPDELVWYVSALPRAF